MFMLLLLFAFTAASAGAPSQMTSVRLNGLNCHPASQTYSTGTLEAPKSPLYDVVDVFLGSTVMEDIEFAHNRNPLIGDTAEIFTVGHTIELTISLPGGDLIKTIEYSSDTNPLSVFVPPLQIRQKSRLTRFKKLDRMIPLKTLDWSDANAPISVRVRCLAGAEQAHVNFNPHTFAFDIYSRAALVYFEYKQSQ